MPFPFFYHSSLVVSRWKTA
ncbi:hypothetical protein OIU74_026942, partial [Salix koriyanagi]